MDKILFTVNYEVKLKRKFDTFLTQYQKEIQYKFNDLKIERYWKIESQFQAKFWIKIELKRKEEIVYKILELANQLVPECYNKNVVGPFNENEQLIFECILNNEEDDQPVKWAHIKFYHDDEE